MNRKEKIDAIYEKIADKTSEEGCRVQYNGRTWTIQYIKKSICEPTEYGGTQNLPEYAWEYYIYYNSTRIITTKEKIKKIIGHPIMIGDVLDFIKKKWKVLGKEIIAQNSKAESDIHLLLTYWENTITPIEEQDDECIDFIYNLIFK